ncbi:MAG: c-type cytochrome, partial [Parachlamydiaceae bacterium]|nr:c-type cytochrome [Parachlamydiaceae bacterium]
MRGDFYQIVLIASGILVTALFGVFLYREIYPEYKIYQNDYIDLEKFRSTYTHEEPPLFKTGIKQIVIEKENKGPAIIDRCITCHVALQIPYFSPTKLAQDSNGQYVVVENEEYIWKKLDDTIAELKNEKNLEELKKQNKSGEIQQRLKLAQSYEDLKRAKVGEQDYDVTKVLRMHPLIGKETRPFEFHPIEEYGCVSCHSGNGRGLVTDKAHGPVFDGQYAMEDLGHNKVFLEPDLNNDPRFSKIFNHKPGAKLLFQTEPILVGDLIQAKCVQCHQSSLKENSISLTNETKKIDPNLSSINQLISNYQRGEELYVSQACYACHRISGFSRGGVGPELTHAGDLYPWYTKRKMMWPKGDLPTSTMPNMRLDHVELEDLMTFLLAQKGSNKAISDMDYRINLRKWEGGQKQEIEKPISPSQMYDTKFSMTVFATEGCAACHRLQGFDSNVGFAIEKQSPNFDQLYQEQQWFKKLFPEVVHINV